jgi:hypothetical protein
MDGLHPEPLSSNPIAINGLDSKTFSVKKTCQHIESANKVDSNFIII